MHNCKIDGPARGRTNHRVNRKGRADDPVVAHDGPMSETPNAVVSEREAEVLALLGDRLSNAEIAGRLHISVRTVESHVSSLLRKAMAPALPHASALAVNVWCRSGRFPSSPMRSCCSTSGPPRSIRTSPPTPTPFAGCAPAYLQANNNDPKPFVWTATAEEILEKVSGRPGTRPGFSPASPGRDTAQRRARKIETPVRCSGSAAWHGHLNRPWASPAHREPFQMVTAIQHRVAASGGLETPITASP
jgi:DNA-binding CsgD family transcriptional regulator